MVAPQTSTRTVWIKQSWHKGGGRPSYIQVNSTVNIDNLKEQIRTKFASFRNNTDWEMAVRFGNHKDIEEDENVFLLLDRSFPEGMKALDAFIAGGASDRYWYWFTWISCILLVVLLLCVFAVAALDDQRAEEQRRNQRLHEQRQSQRTQKSGQSCRVQKAHVR